MLLSGQESIQTSRANNLRLISGDISYQITNRTDDSDTVISWGESVLIGLYDTSLFSQGDQICIFENATVPILWTVYAVEDHWLLVSFFDAITGLIRFDEYMNEQNPSAVTDYKVIYDPSGAATEEYIRKVELHHNYKNLSVEMRALDTLNEYLSFGSMYMIADDTGNVIVYNLSTSLFNNIEEKNIDNVLFDLCISGDEYRPIIRGLTFVEKVADLNYLVFTYNTNFGKQYILFTTNSTLSSFAVYPDIHMTENLYNNVSNDIRVPALYMNMMNNIYSSELIDLYGADVGLLTANISTMYYAKEVFEDDIIYGNGTSYTVLAYTSYSTSVDLNSVFGDGATKLYIIALDEKIFLYTVPSNTDIAEKYNLNNLLLEFDPTSAADYTARILQVYYADTGNAGADKELLYMTYFPAMTFYDSVAKKFRVMI